MPPSLGLLPKQNPLVFDKTKPPVSSSSTSTTTSTSTSTSSNYNYNNSSCDKSTATSITEDLSCISTASSSHSSKHSAYSQSHSQSQSCPKLPKIMTASSTASGTQPPAKASRSLSAPVILHAQSSLLDMTIDESHDEENSIDYPHSSTSPYKTKPKRVHDNHNNNHNQSYNHNHHNHCHMNNSTNSNEVTQDTTISNSSSSSEYDLGSSIIEQTEKNLAAISESMSSSFCIQGADVSMNNDTNNTSSNNNTNNNNHNNKSYNSYSCTLPDCTTFTECSKRKLLFSDTLVQNRLLDDFNFLLGSDELPCSEEKNICNWIVSNCFGTVDNYSVDSHGNGSNADSANERNRIRNRAGESWRARAYRIRRLREERMIQNSASANGNANSYSLSNRRQLSMDRSIRKSRSAEGRIDYREKSCSSTSTLPYSSSRSSSLSMSNTNLHSSSSSNHKKYRRPKHEVNADPLGRMIGDCIDPISPAREDAVELEIVWKDQDTDLCYDSDPGETSYRCKSIVSNDNGTRTSTHKKKKGLRSSTPSKYIARSKQSRFGLSGRRNRFNSSMEKKMDEDPCLEGNDSFEIHVSFEEDTEDEEEEEEEEEDYDDIAANPSGSPWYATTPTLQNVRKKALREDSSIAETVQNAMNRTWTLTWHPIDQRPTGEEKKTKMTLLKSLNTCSPIIMEGSNSSPRCIRLWFERGNRIRGNNIVEPKLMWRDAYHPELTSHRKLNESTTNGPQQICLLSICRILEVKDTVDRTKYPFAKKSCSFLIRTCDDDEFLFEAPTENERDELIYLWKLVVARLASQAVVGDGDKMVGEFFVPSHLGVP